jgi:tetratricopeptide (TPR) repeat protein
MPQQQSKILIQAISAHQAGQLQQAEALYKTYLSDTDDFNASQLLGMVYSKQQKFDLAIKYMGQSLARKHEQPNVHNNLANCLKRQGRLSEAIDHYRTAIALQADYVDAYRNLAMALQEGKEFKLSEQYINKGLILNPRDPALHSLSGHLKKELKDYQGAISSYETSLLIRPEHAITEHNLGVAHRLNNQPQAALQHYQKLLNQNITSFELYQNVGNAYSDIAELDKALACYRQALALNPAYVDAHRNISSLLWSLGMKEQFVQSYEQVFAQNVINDELILSCVESLLAAEQPSLALEYLDQWPVANSDHPNYLDFLGRCQMAAGNQEVALGFHEQACRENPSNAHLLHFGISLLEAGHTDRAAKLLSHVFTVEPDNQYALSHLTLCWRLLGDEREAKVNDYQQFVGEYFVPTPEGFSNMLEFNEFLDSFLMQVHQTKYYPYDQTVRGGTQTHGNLLTWENEALRLLIQSFDLCIHEHLNKVAQFDPPFALFPQTQAFKYSASWSVKLKDQGFHTMHVHPMGWFSSAYYVNLPDDMDQGSREGWLKFGEPNFKLHEPLPAQFYVRPEPGKLALFPSYMWHGTVPFKAQQTRTTVVFDIVPA